MKKKQLKLIAVAVLLMFMTACSKDNSTPEGIRIIEESMVGNNSKVIVNTSDLQNNSWVEGEKIGVRYTSVHSGQDTVEECNIFYANGFHQIWPFSQSYLIFSGLTAFYPCSNGYFVFPSALDYSNPSSPKIQFPMVAQQTPSEEALSLVFRHATGAIVFNIKTGTNVSAKTIKRIRVESINNNIWPGSIVYDGTQSGRPSVTDGRDYNVFYLSSDDISDITLSANGGSSLTCILPIPVCSNTRFKFTFFDDDDNQLSVNNNQTYITSDNMDIVRNTVYCFKDVTVCN